VKSGQPVVLLWTILDDSDIAKIQVFLDDITYGTLQDVKKYSFTLKTPSEMWVGKHTISIQVTDFQKNVTTLVHTVTVQ
jgi:hypothetical protein